MTNFNLDQNEKNRILEMHKKATKNHYLNEQGFPDFGDIFKQGGEMMKQGFDFFKEMGKEQIEKMSTSPFVKQCFEENDVEFPSACTTDPTSSECINAIQDAVTNSVNLGSCIMEKSNMPIANLNK